MSATMAYSQLASVCYISLYVVEVLVLFPAIGLSGEAPA